MILLAAYSHVLAAQRTGAQRRLPSAEKVVGQYIKAVGGKKRLSAIRDATYEWGVRQKDAGVGHITARIKTPAGVRTDTVIGNIEVRRAANARSAWMQEKNGVARTLTDAEAKAAKLQAALEAGRLIDYKRLNVLARVVKTEALTDETTFVVEFSTREGARLQYWFSQSNKLLLQIVDDVNRRVTRFGDYRTTNGILEPHRIEVTSGATETLTLVLQKAAYNTGVGDDVFDPPSGGVVDVAVLLREVETNQKKVDERRTEYTFTEKRIEREVDDKGNLKKETTKVYEIYLLPGGRAVYKMISENGAPLSAERAAKRDKNIEEFLTKYEREREKQKQEREREQQKQASQTAKKKDEVGKEKDDDDDVGVADFLRASEFVSPRRERLRDREAIVMDFRPRAGYRPTNRAESVISKLMGVVWIDPVDKEVMRLEAKLAESYKIGGGLVASLRPGSAFAFEQTRMADGVWLPRFAQVNFAAKLFLLKSIEANFTQEFSDYRRFNTEAGDAVFGAPKVQQ